MLLTPDFYRKELFTVYINRYGYSMNHFCFIAALTLNILTGMKADSTAFRQPLNVNATNFYRERQIQVESGLDSDL